MNEAYKERDLELIRQRATDFKKFQKLQRSQQKEKSIELSYKDRYSCIVYPAIDSLDILSDVVNRLSFALPQKDELKIYITISDTLDVNDISELSTPDFQGHYIGKNKQIYFINESMAKDYLETSFIFLHDASVLKQENIIKHAYKIEIIDKSYFSYIEADTLKQLYFSTLSPDEKQKFLNISKENFKRMKHKNRNKNKAYCFTTGPSFDNYEEFYFEKNSFKVICNSIVKNEKFLSYIGGADLLLFADPVFHFGPSAYAEQFRQDVLKLIDKYDTYILVPDSNMPLLLAHYPQLENRLIGMPGKKEFNFPSDKKFYVKESENILTLYMIPIASSISKEIAIIGADGRNKDEKYFWKHSVLSQYNDKMESAFQTHPSFFRDRNYQDYYEEHCNFIEKLIQYGEKRGNTYYSITSSYIPVLEKRYREGIPSNIAIRSADLCKAILDTQKKKQNI